jgi:muramoyltetrapeptide carboxypeptidase
MRQALRPLLAALAGGLGLFLLVCASRSAPERGTVEAPIIDSNMTEKEAFDGLDRATPRKIRDQQTIVDVLYHGFDGKAHKGQLVVDRDVAKDIREIFDVILKSRFPVGSVIPMSHPKYRKDGRWDDGLSMAANNTSVFNYRPVQDGTALSMHAYGRAIDINPLQNPYIKRGKVLPVGARYDVKAPGTLTPDHPVVKAFLKRGWRWGGNWKTLKDYQHFEKPRAWARAAPRGWLKPRALRAGDTIAFVMPASPIDKVPVLKYAKQLEAEGFRVILPRHLDRVHRFTAGTDEERAAELNAAIRAPGVRAIFPCRGGYGVTRILDRIDYAALRSSPKIITGFSDLTALHLAVARKARLITFHSPMPERDLWREDGDFAYAAASFRRALLAEKYKKGEVGFTVELPAKSPRPVKLVGGKARGRLVGGNLTLICSTLGTPYAIEAKGNILFLEDTNVPPYQIDRALSQLRLAGVVDDVAGVIVGPFLKADQRAVDRIVLDYFGKRKAPVLSHFPVGHGHHNATLPHGAEVELDADAGTLRVLENPVTLD